MIAVHPLTQYRLKSKHIQKKMVKKQQIYRFFSKMTQKQESLVKY